MVSAAAGRGDQEAALIVAQFQCSVGDGKLGAVKAFGEKLPRPLSAGKLWLAPREANH